MELIQYTNQRLLFFTHIHLCILHQEILYIDGGEICTGVFSSLSTNRAVAFLIIWYHERGRLNYIVTKNK